MLYLQVLINGILLGGLYSCIAVGFSLVWGVLNIINIMHGSLIILGAYAAYFAFTLLGINPFVFVPIAGVALFVLGYALQAGVINRVMGAPVLITLTLTFGLNLILENAMIFAFKADYRKVIIDPPLGLIEIGSAFVPRDRLYAMLLALLLVGGLYAVLRTTRIGRAIVAVRMDREAAALMGVNVPRIYAITFGLGALMAGSAGSLMSVIFPISPLTSVAFLGKAFVICVLGGLGSIPGVMVGGIALGVLESFGSLWLGPDYSTTIAFVLLLALLMFRPTGIMGKRGFE
ncbi:MAG: high-affinity branched-chain amino acid transport system permease [Betaproteobacteria bacterium]|jgi:branched-chain amino acid transport system permease protein|nr:high-affinity branched-chain amino acid transport system permease [Betaproteobacteria bacterium]